MGRTEKLSAGSSINDVEALQTIPLDQLRPDWENPRFPYGVETTFADDDDVLVYLDQQFDAFSVAESIARHGFFPSEPLIVVKVAPSEYVVLEGNRRLAALKGLSSPALRGRMKDRRWANLKVTIEPPHAIPALVASSRAEVAPILGYRHVTGITPWEPHQQARFVASLIDDPDNPLTAEQVSERIGRDVSEVRAFYRNYSIVEQARDMFQTDDTDRVVEEFGVWTRAMTSSGIREYIGAPAPRQVAEGDYPLAVANKENLERVVTWIFGAPRTEEEIRESKQSREGRVIDDSRKLSRLGRVLQSERGRAALEAGDTLAEAERAALDVAAQFAGLVKEAADALKRADRIATSDLIAANRDLLIAARGQLGRMLEHG